MNKYSFYKPEQIRPLYKFVIPAYQHAFASWPWHEVSKCIDPEQSCTGGLSPLAVGHYCGSCGLCTEKPAYETQELRDRFDTLAATRPVSWFVEGNSDGLNLFALAWRATPAQIAKEKYVDVPAMENWLKNKLGDEPIVWLDETFADKEIQPRGNLRNFRSLCEGFVERLGGTALAFRTITPQMLAVAERDFGVLPTAEVPDRRSFIAINFHDQRSES